jgi:acyl carrier protein
MLADTTHSRARWSATPATLTGSCRCLKAIPFVAGRLAVFGLANWTYVHTRREMQSKADRAQLTQEVIELFVSIIGFIPRNNITPTTNFVRDFHIIDDDLTCFMMQVKWRYNLKPTPEDWARIETIDEVIDLILAGN